MIVLMKRVLIGTLTVICLFLALDALVTFRTNLIIFTVAWMLAFMLMPLVNLAQNYLRLPRMLAAFLVIVALVLTFYPLSTILYRSLLQFFERIGIYEDQLNIIINGLAGQFKIDLSFFGGRFDFRDWFLAWLPSQTAFLLGSANKFLGFAAGFAAKVMVILFFVLFILNEGNLILRKVNVLLSGENSRLVNTTITSITNQIGRYLLLKTATSLLTGVLVYSVLHLFGVEAPLTWGFFTFILNFIPNVGSVLITLLISAMSLVQFYPDWNKVLLIFLSIIAIQVVVGNILDPKLQGDQLDLSPLVILLALLFWGTIWGLEGAFLAVPLTETMKIICANTKSLRPIAVLISSGKTLPRTASETRDLAKRRLRWFRVR